MVSLTAPYVSGFLAFREVPFLVDAVRRLREKEPRLVPQAGASTPGRRALSFHPEGKASASLITHHTGRPLNSLERMHLYLEERDQIF